VLVARTCNPCYSGGRDQEDQLEAILRQIVHETLSQKYVSQKRSGGMVKGVVKTQNPPKKKKTTQ
jgi:hypothetical protein